MDNAKYIGEALDSIWFVIQYHMWWPGAGNDPMFINNEDMNRARTNFYDNTVVPRMFTNGKESTGNPDIWVNDAKKYEGSQSLFTIDMSGNQDDQSYSIEVRMSALVAPADQTLALFVAAIVDSVDYPNSANGLTIHHNVVMDMVAGNSGEVIEFNENLKQFWESNWTVPNAWLNETDFDWAIENIWFVAWIQDLDTKEIIQANKLKNF